MKQKAKLIIILTVEFIVIIAILLLIFLAGKKTYTVRFELNGGTLISGSEEQRVTRGKDASPPIVTKDGCYLLKWSASYKEVTRDLVIEAVWEYETSYGITYTVEEGSNYCEISGSYEEIGGDVYIGAYHDQKKVLGIEEGAFENRTRITSVYLLDGILSIEDNAFAGCTNLETIVLPSTLINIGDNAFKDCINLKTVIYTEPLEHMEEAEKEEYLDKAMIVLPDKLERVGDNVFSGCKRFTEIYIPESVQTMGSNVFEAVVEPNEEDKEEGGDIVLPPVTEEEEKEELTLKVYVYTLTEKPEGWKEDWFADNTKVVWGYEEAKLEEETEKDKDKE